MSCNEQKDPLESETKTAAYTLDSIVRWMQIDDTGILNDAETFVETGEIPDEESDDESKDRNLGIHLQLLQLKLQVT